MNLGLRSGGASGRVRVSKERDWKEDVTEETASDEDVEHVSAEEETMGVDGA